MFKTGDILGSYRIVRPLGKGGMGEVYEVEHARLGVRYALKAFMLAHGDVALLRERFVAEGKVLARLNHPNLVRVFELDQDAATGVLYFVMDLVRSPETGPGSFAELEDAPAEERDLARWFAQLGAALDYIHARGVVHRDLKPGNILIDEKGDVRLVDFGVSRYVSEAMRREVLVPFPENDGSWRNGSMGLKMGTGGFMAPEVAAGKPATAASDAYSLGLVFFYLLTGLAYEPTRPMLRMLEPLEGAWRPALDALLQPQPAARPKALAALGGRIFPSPAAGFSGGSRVRRGLAWGVAALACVVAGVALVLKTGAPSAAFPEGEPVDVALGAGQRMSLVWCPPGEFTMGSPATEPGRFENEAQHRVRLTKGFWIADRETTQGQWKSVMDGQTVVDLARLARDASADGGPGSGNDEARKTDGMADRWTSARKGAPEDRCGDVNDAYPVYYVSWEQATNFCARLNRRERARGRLPAGYAYRLPTEAEWEYACRAGSETGLPGNRPLRLAGPNVSADLDAFAWFGGNSSRGFAGRGFDCSRWPGRMDDGAFAAPRACATRTANDWGVHDMLGNVWEWCADWYDAGISKETAVDPQGPTSGRYRVVRGGSWNAFARQCRAAYRDGFPSGLGNFIGFRVVLAPE